MVGVEVYAADGIRAKDAHRWLRGRCWEEWQDPGTPDDPRYSDDPAVRAQAYGTTITDRSRPAWMDRKDA
jgi:hypothetical protein